MAENTKLTSLELNGVTYGLGKSIYAELDMSLERFVELLGRDFYCPTLASAPTSSTVTYTDTDDSVNTFQTGQPCRWQEGGAWRLAVCTNNTGSAATWYVLPTKVSELINDKGYLTEYNVADYINVPVIEHETSDTSLALTPNEYHIWDVVSSLSLSLAAPSDTSIYNEYMFEFTSGSSATTLTLPSDIKWVVEPDIQANTTYQVSIVNNLGVIGGFQ